MATLLDPSDATLTVFLPGPVVARLRLGEEARIVLEGSPRQVLPARVSFVSAEAQFTPKFVETQQERERLSYRVKLSVPEDVALAQQALLKSGMTATGALRLDAKTPWPANLAVTAGAAAGR